MESMNENSSGYPLLCNKPPRVAVASAAMVVIFPTVWGSTGLSTVVFLLLVISSGSEITRAALGLEHPGWPTHDTADDADCESEPQLKRLT